VREIEILTKRVADIPADAEAWYGLGVLLLEGSLAESDVGAVAAAADALSQSLRLGRTSPWTCAALGYVEDMSGDANLALQHFADARKLDPAEPLHEIYALSLLIDSGAEVEALAGIEAAASRHQVDLEALRRDIASVTCRLALARASPEHPAGLHRSSADRVGRRVMRASYSLSRDG
jgi:tetratricopeptide (TPR) repeat protein